MTGATTLQWTETEYDALGRTKKATQPDGSFSAAEYNTGNFPSSATSGTGAEGRTVKSTDAWGRERWGRFDALDRLAEMVEPNPNPTVSTTNKGSVADSGNLMTKYTYDLLGNLTKTEQGVQVREFKYDGLGRLVRQKLAEQTATLNDAGVYVGTAPANNPKWSEALVYDERSNVTLKTDARGVKTHYLYEDPATSVSDPLNRIRAINYDLTGPYDTSLYIPTAFNATFDYMTTGDQQRIQKIESPGLSKEEYTYDSQSRVQDDTQTLVNRTSRPMSVSYLYDTFDRVTDVAYPAQYGITGDPRKTVHRDYDNLGRLTGQKYNGSQQAGNILYNAAGQTTSIDIGAGTNQENEEYTFDAQTGLLARQKVTKGTASPTLDLSYDYTRGTSSVGSASGKAGILSKITDNKNSSRDRAYQYDALGRLTKVQGGANLWSEEYSYDRYGNRQSVTATGATANSVPIPVDGTAALSYDSATNRITTSGYVYDVQGNQIQGFGANGQGLRYYYDTANRLSVITDLSYNYVQAFQYGPAGNRLMNFDASAGQFILYISVGGATIAEYQEITANVPFWTKGYTYLGDQPLSTLTMVTNGTTSSEKIEFNHPDRLGTKLISDQVTGTSSEQTTLPFGTVLPSESPAVTNRIFTSYDRSSATVGLDYAVNRNYDSKQGRFTQVDPLGGRAVNTQDPQSLNLYTYCNNDPINRTDPNGLFWGVIKSFFKQVLRIIVFRAVVTALTLVAFAAPQFIAGIIGTIIKFSLFIFAELIRFKLGTEIIGSLKEWFNRCNAPDYGGLSQGRQDELSSRGVSSEQWDHLKNKQRLGYFNITAAIAAAGLSLIGWLVDWAAGGIMQDRTLFKAGEGATNLAGQVHVSGSFSEDIFKGREHPGYEDSYRLNSFSRSTQLSFDPGTGTKLDADIDLINPNRTPFGTILHAVGEGFLHKLGGFLGGGSKTNPYNVAYRSSWECK